MKTIVRSRYMPFSILALTMGPGLAANGCSTTAVNPTDGGSSSSSSSGGGAGSSSSGVGGSSGGGSSGGGSSGSTASSSSSGGGVDAGGCFGTAGSCTLVTAPSITDFETWMPTTADGAVNNPANFSFYVNGAPPVANGVLGGLLYINDGDGMPALTMVPGYMSNWAVHMGTTTAPTMVDAGTSDYGGLLIFYFPFPSVTMPSCVNPANYSGIQFWVQGQSGSISATAPNGLMGVSLSTVETEPMSANAATPSGGTCDATADAGACKAPGLQFAIPATWTLKQLPWGAFVGGISNSGCAGAPGSGILRLVLQPFESYPPPNYQVSPMPYFLEVDNVSFY
jgi:hypothetical protein